MSDANCQCPACRPPLSADGVAPVGRPFKVAAFMRNTGDGVRIEYRELVRVPTGHSVSIKGPGLTLDGDHWVGREGPVEVEVRIDPMPTRPIPARASAVDARRLRDGAKAVRLLAVEPVSRVEAQQIINVLSDGACALQSTDDLGTIENLAVAHDLHAILDRRTDLSLRMAEDQFPDVVIGCTRASAPPPPVAPPTPARAPEPGETLPRCDRLDGSSLAIVTGNIEAGRFCEAQAVTITDGTRSAVYVPLEQLLAEREQHYAGGV